MCGRRWVIYVLVRRETCSVSKRVSFPALQKKKGERGCWKERLENRRLWPEFPGRRQMHTAGLARTQGGSHNAAQQSIFIISVTVVRCFLVEKKRETVTRCASMREILAFFKSII